MKSGGATMDDLLEEVRKILKPYRTSPHYEDIVSEGVVAALSCGDSHRGWYVRGAALKYLHDVNSPVNYPYRNKTDNRLSEKTRSLGVTTTVQIKEDHSTEEDHSDRVLIEATVSNLRSELRKFAEELLGGSNRNQVMSSMGLSRNKYYSMKEELVEILGGPS